MEEFSTYSECEERLIRDEGYDSEQAAQICASSEGRRSDEEEGKSRSGKDEDWDENWGLE